MSIRNPTANSQALGRHIARTTVRSGETEYAVSDATIKCFMLLKQIFSPINYLSTFEYFQLDHKNI